MDYYNFLRCNFTKTNKMEDIISVSKIYDLIKEDKYYKSLTKEKKRKILLSDLFEYYKNHNETKNFYKERFTERVNGKQIEKRNVLRGYTYDSDEVIFFENIKLEHL